MPRSRLLVPRVPPPKPGVGATIDWAHPLASRLCVALLLNEWGATQCQSLVGLTRAPFTGTTKPSWRGGARAGLAFPGGANTVGYLTLGTETWATDLGRNTSNPATWMVRAWIVATGSNSLLARNDGNTISAGWQLDYAGGSLVYTHESSATNMNVTVSAFPTGRWVTIAVVSDGSLTATAQRIYVDGLLQPHASNTNGAGTPGSDAGQTLYVGRGNAAYTANTSFDGSLDWVYLWKRMLSPAEVLTLARDPYAFVRDPAAMFLGATGGAGPPAAAERVDTYLWLPV